MARTGETRRVRWERGYCRAVLRRACGDWLVFWRARLWWRLAVVASALLGGAAVGHLKGDVALGSALGIAALIVVSFAMFLIMAPPRLAFLARLSVSTLSDGGAITLFDVFPVSVSLGP